jgi:L-phenylalanine/L-methionine N-acetyltransferase
MNRYFCNMYRKTTLSDFDFIFHLYMHPQVNPHLLYEQMSAEDFKAIFKKLLASDILYVFEEDNKKVGMFKLIPQTYRSAHVAYLGSFAIDPAFGGRGLGTKMLMAIIDLSKQTGIKRIELSAGVQNKNAIALYKKCGFKEEGILRKYTYFKSEDRYIDEVMMSYIIE